MNDEKVRRPRILRQIIAALSGSLAMISVGQQISWPAPSMPQLLAIDSDIPVTSSQGAWIIAFQGIGSLPGSLFCSFIVDRWGRKTLLLLMSIPLCISCVISAFGTTYWWLYIARFISGVGTGNVMTTLPMYMSEIGDSRLRGGFGTLITVMMVFGFLVSYTVGPWTSRTIFSAVGAMLPIIFAICFACVPESPIFYAMNNQPHKAEKSLVWLRGTPDVADEMAQVQKIIANKKNQTSGTAMQLLTEKGSRKALIISFGLVTCHQFSGMTTILAYSSVILDGVDSGLSSSHSVIIMGLVQLLAGICVVFITTKAGTRPLLLTSMVMCMFFLLVEAVYFHIQSYGVDVTRISWIPLVAFIGHLISFSLGVGPLPAAVSAEVFPCEVKAVGMTAMTFWYCVTGIWVTKLHQILTDGFGIHVSFYTFATSGILCTLFILFFVPETKNRSLSEIQNQLRGLPEPTSAERDVRKELIKC